ncbi:UNVERIFIED_CONTAM: hypothetical protein GTU68_052983 [Idotea baltica]|nr:hypothetical protein [Idotea baltica]
MAKKSLIARQKKREKLVDKYKIKRQNLKKINLYNKLQKLPRDSSATRLNNRCLITGRPKGYYRNFGLSRHVLREMAHNCLLPGLAKSSW